MTATTGNDDNFQSDVKPSAMASAALGDSARIAPEVQSPGADDTTPGFAQRAKTAVSTTATSAASGVKSRLGDSASSVGSWVGDRKDDAVDLFTDTRDAVIDRTSANQRIIGTAVGSAALVFVVAYAIWRRRSN